MSSPETLFSGNTFEEEVRHVANLLWPSENPGGARLIDGRERDGIFETDEIFYVIEATTSKKKAKIEYDGKKTSDLVKELRKTSGKFAKGFLITLDDPTADQILAAKDFEKTLNILSFDQFCSKLVDSRRYLSMREKAPFGSIYDFSSNSHEVSRDDFIEPSIQNTLDSTEITLTDISRSLVDGGRFVFLAEYGTGKSMCMRELYFSLVKKYYSKETLKFPVYINLRDHMGQKEVDELIERHGRLIGFSKPNDLVRAWRAGYIDLFLDGFDELSSRGWTGDPRRIRDLRRATQIAVRNIIRQSPRRAGIVISGRAGYFDTLKEMNDCLSIDNFKLLRLYNFNEHQVSLFLKKKSLHEIIPSWVPTRPLLLGYLASRGIIAEVCQYGKDNYIQRGEAWSELLHMIVRREAEQLEGTDPDTLLTFFAKLATKARKSEGGVGRFSSIEIEDLFFRVTGRTPIDDDRNMLLRLPGLGSSADGNGGRSFIDADLADAASGYDLSKYLSNPYDDSEIIDLYRDLKIHLGSIGIEVAAHVIQKYEIKSGAIASAINTSQKQHLSQISYDIFGVIMFLGFEIDYDIVFTECDIGTLDLEEIASLTGGVTLNSCMIDTILIPIDPNFKFHFTFNDCLINNIIGRLSSKDLSDKHFVRCVFGEFIDSPDRNNAIMETDLPETLKVLLVSLRKIFQQKGAGRKESALYRGLDAKSRPLVPEVIDILIRSKFVLRITRRGETIFLPNRNKVGEAMSIINRPFESKSTIVQECLSMK